MNAPLWLHGFPFNSYPYFLAWQMLVQAVWG